MTEHTIDTSDGACGSFVFTPAQGSGPWPPVLLYMDGPGIRPALDAMAQRLADNGYYVLLPNLHYRLGSLPTFDFATATQADRDQLMTRVRAIDNMLVMKDTEAYVRFLDADPRAQKGTLRVVGYCMGGGLALSAAGTFPDRVVAAAAYHGGRLATDSPTSPHLLAKKAKGELYVAVAELDQGFSAEEQAKVREVIRAVEVYPGAKHGFAVDGHPAYDRTSAERHWSTLLALFSEHR